MNARARYEISTHLVQAYAYGPRTYHLRAMSTKHIARRRVRCPVAPACPQQTHPCRKRGGQAWRSVLDTRCCCSFNVSAARVVLVDDVHAPAHRAEEQGAAYFGRELEPACSKHRASAREPALFIKCNTYSTRGCVLTPRCPARRLSGAPHLLSVHLDTGCAPGSSSWASCVAGDDLHLWYTLACWQRVARARPSRAPT